MHEPSNIGKTESTASSIDNPPSTRSMKLALPFTSSLLFAGSFALKRTSSPEYSTPLANSVTFPTTQERDAAIG